MTLVDPGSAKICAAVCSGGEYLGLAVRPTPGWPKRDATQAEIASAIAAAVAEADTMAGRRSSGLWLALSGDSLRYTIAQGTARVRSHDGRVGPDDVRKAVDAACSPGTEYIHRFHVSSYLEGVEILENPTGKKGNRLETRVISISVEAGRRAELLQACSLIGLPIEGFVLSSLAAAFLLTPAEKEIGTALLDLGGVHSSLAVFARGAPRHLATVPLGGLHVTKDLAVAFGLPLPKAEETKLGGAVRQEAAPPTQELLAKVISARITESLEMIHNELRLAGWVGRLPGGFVLTGGAALSASVLPLAEEVLGHPARIGLPKVGGTLAMTAGPAYAVILGLDEAAKHYAIGMSMVSAPKGVGGWRSRLQPRNLPV